MGIEVRLHLFLTQTLDGLSGGLTAPAALPWTKKSPVFAKQEAG